MPQSKADPKLDRDTMTALLLGLKDAGELYRLRQRRGLDPNFENEVGPPDPQFQSSQEYWKRKGDIELPNPGGRQTDIELPNPKKKK